MQWVMTELVGAQSDACAGEPHHVVLDRDYYVAKVHSDDIRTFVRNADQVENFFRQKGYTEFASVARQKGFTIRRWEPSSNMGFKLKVSRLQVGIVDEHQFEEI